MRWFYGIALAACTSSGAANNAAADTSGDAGATPTSTVDAGATSTCPTVSTTSNAGNVTASQINEASGIVASALNPGVYWTHNDSGDKARGFALSSTGALLATLTFDSAEPTDIEDIAIEDTASGANLYFADIGDNSSNRADVVIFRVAEPKLAAGATNATLTATSDKMHVKYADGAHDAETLLFDPRTKDLFVATKVIFGNSAIYRIGNYVAGGTATASRIASVPVPLATGGDITRAGDLIAIRNYGLSAYAWQRGSADDLAAALSRPPCTLPVASEHQGEAFGFLADGSGYITTSEGKNPPLNVSRFR